MVWRFGWFGWQGEELVFRPWAPDATVVGWVGPLVGCKVFQREVGLVQWLRLSLFVGWRSGQRRQFERLPTEVLCARIPDWQGANSNSVCKL